MRRLATNFPTREIGKKIDYEALKRHGYRNQGIVVVRIDDQRLNEFDRQFLKNIGNKLYGGN